LRRFFFKILQMAINVNDVYQTVLLILNKEQRGYMTPFEFNKIATQVQREIFERYFEDLNLYSRTPQTEIEYADRLKNTEEKLEVFRTEEFPTYTGGGFDIPEDLYRLGGVTFRDFLLVPGVANTYNFSNEYVELQPVDRHEFNLVSRSKLTAPSKSWPIYLYERNKIFVKPTSINLGKNLTTIPPITEGSILIDYIRKPENVVWAYTVGSLDQYIYAPQGTSGVVTPASGSVDFELHNSEQTEVVINILFYAGVVIRDPQIVQVATQKIQQEETLEKQ